jgi:predicted  nucleic acid-binding Zn-ribbon protein
MLLSNTNAAASPAASPTAPKSESSAKTHTPVRKTRSQLMREYVSRKAVRERLIKKHTEAISKETDATKKADLQKKILDLQKNNKILDDKMTRLQKRIDEAKAAASKASASKSPSPAASPSASPSASSAKGGFYVKYLKYKAKYLQLKADLDV